MPPSEQPPRRARHLIDPSRPPAPPTAEDTLRLQRVQRWVMSVLATTTILHLAAGLAIGALFIDEDEVVARVGLCVLGATTGVLGLATGFLIHGRSPVTPWVALGLVPGLVALVLVTTA